MAKTARNFHILSLSGGGFRGLFTARVLAGLEEKAGKPLAQCFDLICGTSIGGMIAMGLGMEKPAREMADLIHESGANIFSGRGCGIWGTKYGNQKLQKIVQKIFDNKNLCDIRHKILVPAVNYSTGKPRMFKTWWRDKGGDMKVTDAVLAATAAPYFFPIWKTQDKYQVSYLDGGLYANSPGLLGVHEAVFRLNVGIDRVHLLSVGTMESDEAISDNNLNLGKYGWMRDERLFKVIASVQGNLVNFMLEQQLNDRYHRIEKHPTPGQYEKLGLDAATPDAADILCSTAQSEIQSFIGAGLDQKWLGHVPDLSLTTKEKSDEKTA